jgi:hypothetical protein
MSFFVGKASLGLFKYSRMWLVKYRVLKCHNNVIFLTVVL